MVAATHEDGDRVVLRNISWGLFQQILRAKGEHAGPRLAYLDGALELMSPSREHERIRTMIGRLLEGYAAERGTSTALDRGRYSPKTSYVGSSPTSAT